MISYNTLLQQSLSRGLQSPHYIPPKQKINTDQLNNACLAIVVNYNTLISYEKRNLPVDRYDSITVTLQNGEIRDQSKKRLKAAELMLAIPKKAVVKLNCRLFKKSKKKKETRSYESDLLQKHYFE